MTKKELEQKFEELNKEREVLAERYDAMKELMKKDEESIQKLLDVNLNLNKTLKKTSESNLQTLSEMLTLQKKLTNLHGATVVYKDNSTELIPFLGNLDILTASMSNVEQISFSFTQEEMIDWFNKISELQTKDNQAINQELIAANNHNK